MTVESTGASNSQMMVGLMSLPLQGASQNLQELQKTIEAFQKSQESMRDLLIALEQQNQVLSNRVTHLETSITQERAAHQKVHEAVQQGLTQLQSNLEKKITESAQGSQANLQALRQEFAMFTERYARHIHLPIGPLNNSLSQIPYSERTQFHYVPFTVNGGQRVPIHGVTGTPATLDPGGNRMVRK